MKTKTLFSVAAAGLILSFCSFFAPSAFAIDRITLTSGEELEGTILSDAPHQHVDFELLNGNKTRIPHDQVVKMERDVPSNHEVDMWGASSKGYFGALLGITDNVTITKSALFAFGLRGGVNTSQMGNFAKLAFGLEYNYARDTGSALLKALTSHEITFQMLFRKISNGGLYFGPEAGLAIFNTENSSGSSNFEMGVVLGYDFFLNNGFSLGAETKFDHIFGFDHGIRTGVAESFDFFKVMISGTFHF